MIRKVKEGYRVVAESGRNIRTLATLGTLPLLVVKVGTYPSREQVEKRLRQIEFFKHLKKK